MSKQKKPRGDKSTSSKADARSSQIKGLWQDLVVSAFDFFEQAVEQHDKSTKYATLHLATSAELFLKARLMAEHWALIVSPKNSPDFQQLRSGDFQSVTIKEAFDRLRGVLPAEEAVSKEAEIEFDALATERNKVAHFFHSGFDDKTKHREILQRQCRVWLHLHRLLTENWASTFSQFTQRLQSLDRKMRRERKFLQTVFDHVFPELQKQKKSGKPVETCPSCGFESFVLDASTSFAHGKCPVCDYQQAVMSFECPSCEKQIIIESGYAYCPECRHAFTPAEVSEVLGGTRPDDDTGYCSRPVNCCECATDSVYFLNDRYVCLNCMEECEEISACQWCNEFNTGDTEMSYLNGCSMCDGLLGWKGDRD